MSAVAPGGKVSELEYNTILDWDALYNAVPRGIGLSCRQIQRIVNGDSWKRGWLPARVGEEWKACKVCGAQFERRYSNGRLRSPKFWAQKETCCHSHAVQWQWAKGAFSKRGKT
jgi:hypothetical protein